MMEAHLSVGSQAQRYNFSFDRPSISPAQSNGHGSITPTTCVFIYEALDVGFGEVGIEVCGNKKRRQRLERVVEAFKETETPLASKSSALLAGLTRRAWRALGKMSDWKPLKCSRTTYFCLRDMACPASLRVTHLSGLFLLGIGKSTLAATRQLGFGRVCFEV